jgi:YD repeat-containing protein
MKLLVSVSIAVVLVSLPAAAIAQVAQTYQYDANGRLTGVTTTGAAGTNTAAYVYDDTDNRTSRSQTGTTAYAALSQLPIHDDLQPFQALVSPNGRFSLAVRDSGALELWADQSIVWSNLTDEFARPIFTVDGTGNARFRGIGPEVDHPAGAYLALGDEGDLALFDGVGSTVLLRPTQTSDAEATQ